MFCEFRVRGSVTHHLNRTAPRCFISLIVVSLSLAVIGCRPPACNEATAEADDAVGSSAVAGELHLSAEACRDPRVDGAAIEPTRRILR